MCTEQRGWGRNRGTGLRGTKPELSQKVGQRCGQTKTFCHRANVRAEEAWALLSWQGWKQSHWKNLKLNPLHYNIISPFSHNTTPGQNKAEWSRTEVMSQVINPQTLVLHDALTSQRFVLEIMMNFIETSDTSDVCVGINVTGFRTITYMILIYCASTERKKSNCKLNITRHTQP